MPKTPKKTNGNKLTQENYLLLLIRVSKLEADVRKLKKQDSDLHFRFQEGANE